MSSERNRLDQGDNQPNEGEASDNFSKPEPESKEVNHEIAIEYLEALKEKGVHIDLLLYLIGKIEIDRVEPFSRRELQECHRILDELIPKKDEMYWKRRFELIQTKVLYQNPTLLKKDPI